MIRLPTLKFTVPDSARDREWKLADMKFGHRYGIKIVRLSGTCMEDDGRTIRHFICPYPDAQNELKPGFDCWILPHLHDAIQIDEESSVQRNLTRAFDHLYEAPEGDVRVHRAYPGAQGLVGFMAELGLREEDLTVDFLECRAVPWVGKVAASICSPDFADFLLGHFCRRFWQSPATVQPLLSCLFTHLGAFPERDWGG
ncbi:unnamed protein product [Effrenium voratum]|uniref:Uncharacterized protein n=1 Tax=Effrenium voratum TaxID=2562239 RepID=A0AA36NK84_9DINO|nr:unnamed protein product [Effrenium voratum]